MRCPGERTDLANWREVLKPYFPELNLNHYWVVKIPLPGILGFTFYNFILLHPKAGLEVIAHELVHMRQVKRLGRLRFGLKYLWDWLKAGYSENLPLEKDAYQLQDKVWRELRDGE